MIEHLFIKKEKKKPLINVDHLNLQKGIGIETDVSANKITPRQVLLVQKDTLTEYNLEPGAFRENITVTNFDLNNIQSGTELKIGDEVKIKITFNCEPCQYITSLGITDFRKLTNRRGKLAIVTESGTIKLKDTIEIVSTPNEPWIPGTFIERLGYVIERVPQGKVLTYAKLAKAAGVPSSYVRTFPQLLSKLAEQKIPVHRIINGQGQPTSDQINQLEKEKIEFKNELLNLYIYEWDSSRLYYD